MMRGIGNWLAGKVSADGLLLAGMLAGWIILQMIVLPRLGVST